MKYYEELNGDWEEISRKFEDRNVSMCYSRYRRLMQGKKKYWSEEVDQKIKELVSKMGYQWKSISKQIHGRYVANLGRNPKQIREHYLNFLRPDILKTEWTPKEDLKICELVQEKGRCWKKF